MCGTRRIGCAAPWHGRAASPPLRTAPCQVRIYGSLGLYMCGSTVYAANGGDEGSSRNPGVYISLFILALAYIVLVYLLWFAVTRNINLLSVQLDRIYSRGIRPQSTPLYVKYCMFRRLRNAFLSLQLIRFIASLLTWSAGIQVRAPWLSHLVDESLELLFFIAMGYTFRPRDFNPYFYVISDSAPALDMVTPQPVLRMPRWDLARPARAPGRPAVKRYVVVQQPDRAIVLGQVGRFVIRSVGPAGGARGRRRCTRRAVRVHFLAPCSPAVMLPPSYTLHRTRRDLPRAPVRTESHTCTPMDCNGFRPPHLSFALARTSWRRRREHRHCHMQRSTGCPWLRSPRSSPRTRPRRPQLLAVLAPAVVPLVLLPRARACLVAEQRDRATADRPRCGAGWTAVAAPRTRWH